MMRTTLVNNYNTNIILITMLHIRYSDNTIMSIITVRYKDTTKK